jgi:hypothetical protein
MELGDEETAQCQAPPFLEATESSASEMALDGLAAAAQNSMPVQPTAKRADSLDIHVDGEATLTVAAVISKKDYINDRTRLVNGKRVREAVGTLVPNTKGEIVKYKFGDLKYDVQRGLLLVDGEERSGPEGEGSVVKPVKPRKPRKRQRDDMGDNGGGKKPRDLPASGYYGVTTNGKRWKARITHNGKKHHIGSFGTRQEAALAYDNAARQCGEDEPLNYDSIAVGEADAAKHKAKADIEFAKQARTAAQLVARPESGYYGVRQSGDRWTAYVFYGGTRHYLGIFDTKHLAALAYDREAGQCGQAKPMNFESIEAGEKVAAAAQPGCLPPPEPPLSFSAAPQTITNRNGSTVTLALLPAGVAHISSTGVHLSASTLAAVAAGRSASGFYGVTAEGKRWRAQINHGGKQHRIGSFDTKQMAARAYDRAARKCGEEKPLNFPNVASIDRQAAVSLELIGSVGCCRVKLPEAAPGVKLPLNYESIAEGQADVAAATAQAAAVVPAAQAAPPPPPTPPPPVHS